MTSSSISPLSVLPGFPLSVPMDKDQVDGSTLGIVEFIGLDDSLMQFFRRLLQLPEVSPLRVDHLLSADDITECPINDRDKQPIRAAVAYKQVTNISHIECCPTVGTSALLEDLCGQ